MIERVDRDRRRFLGAAAMTIAAARLGSSGTVEANQRVSRQLRAIGAAAEWINSPRLTPVSLAGKVVVVDFWTYTCINWLRTLPYVRAWAEAFGEEVVVIGVHTPEFTFERDLGSVRGAVRQMRIDYPVVIDNDRSIWRAFENQYWPALYFIDGRGSVRHHVFGEGKYRESELVIERLLAERGAGGHDHAVNVTAVGIETAADWENLKSPETYLGYDRTQNFASRGRAQLDRRRVYAAPARLALNEWALGGEWTIGREAAVLGSSTGGIVYRFHARDVHLVMGPLRRESPVRFRVSIDGEPPGAAHGLDVDESGSGTVLEHRLYQLIRQPGRITDRQIEIEFRDAAPQWPATGDRTGAPGVETFAFTFG